MIIVRVHKLVNRDFNSNKKINDGESDFKFVKKYLDAGYPR